MLMLTATVEILFTGKGSYSAAGDLQKRLDVLGIQSLVTCYSTLGPDARNSVKVDIADYDKALPVAELVLANFNKHKIGEE